MLKSDGDKNGKKSRGLISKNNNFARAVHFFFFHISLPLLLQHGIS